MNEDITETIYFAMLEAGYNKPEAEFASNSTLAKEIYSTVEKISKKTLYQLLTETYKDLYALLTSEIAKKEWGHK